MKTTVTRLSRSVQRRTVRLLVVVKTSVRVIYHGMKLLNPEVKKGFEDEIVFDLYSVFP